MGPRVEPDHSQQLLPLRVHDLARPLEPDFATVQRGRTSPLPGPRAPVGPLPAPAVPTAPQPAGITPVLTPQAGAAAVNFRPPAALIELLNQHQGRAAVDQLLRHAAPAQPEARVATARPGVPAAPAAQPAAAPGFRIEAGAPLGVRFAPPPAAPQPNAAEPPRPVARLANLGPEIQQAIAQRRLQADIHSRQSHEEGGIGVARHARMLIDQLA